MGEWVGLGRERVGQGELAAPDSKLFRRGSLAGVATTVIYPRRIKK